MVYTAQKCRRIALAPLEHNSEGISPWLRDLAAPALTGDHGAACNH